LPIHDNPEMCANLVAEQYVAQRLDDLRGCICIEEKAHHAARGAEP
jgi:hypothetical protein